MVKKFGWILLFISHLVFADTYDATTNRLSIQRITVAGVTYNNLIVTIAGVISYNTGTPGTEDLYDPITNILTIPSITVAGTTYTNVKVSVGNVLQVNGAPSTLMGGAIQGNPLVLSGTVVTILGDINGTSGAADGFGLGARFFSPNGMTSDGVSLYVTDEQNASIRRVNVASGQVTTVAGPLCAYCTGYADGIGSAALFSGPAGITTDGTSLYVCDMYNHLIRKVVIATGEVTTLAGIANRWGSTNGVGTAASFNTPTGITTDGTNLYVADQQNNKIRKIVIATGVVTTLAGSGVAGWADGTGTAAKFNYPQAITTDGSNLYVADFRNARIRKIVIATGQVTTLAGGNGTNALDGIGTAAGFGAMAGITTDGTNLYVTEVPGRIRKIVISTGAVSTLAGNDFSGIADGVGTAVSFGTPYGIVTDGQSLYVNDLGFHHIRRIW